MLSGIAKETGVWLVGGNVEEIDFDENFMVYARFFTGAGRTKG